MKNNHDLIKKVDVESIVDKGAKIYEKIKFQYEPKDNGNYLAIEVKSKDVYLGTTSSEAVEFAREKHPDTVFYVVKIGHSVAETLAKLKLRND